MVRMLVTKKVQGLLIRHSVICNEVEGDKYKYISGTKCAYYSHLQGYDGYM